jgi:hypothetical protein
LLLFFLFLRYAIVHPFAVAINLSATVNEEYPGLAETVIVLDVTPLANPLNTSTIIVLPKFLFANDNEALTLVKGALVTILPAIEVRVVPAFKLSAGSILKEVVPAKKFVKLIALETFISPTVFIEPADERNEVKLQFVLPRVIAGKLSKT